MHVVVKATMLRIISYGSPRKQIQNERDDSSGLCPPSSAQDLDRASDIMVEIKPILFIFQSLLINLAVRGKLRYKVVTAHQDVVTTATLGNLH